MIKKGILLTLAAVLSLALAAPVFAASPGEVISNVLTSTITATPEPPTITVKDLDTSPPVTLTDEFSVSTTPGGYRDTMVRVRVTLTEGDPSGFALEYWEDQDGQYHALPFTQENGAYVAWYGPSGGFPLKDATSDFRVTWKKMGTYEGRLDIMPVGSSEVLASTEVTVNVGPALTVGWSLPATFTATTNQSFTVETWAQKDGRLAQVDRVLYVIEVTTQDGTRVGTEVVTAKAQDGQSLGYDSQGKFFHWGPRTGFKFDQERLETTFTVTILQDGTYNVKAYAVQLP